MCNVCVCVLCTVCVRVYVLCIMCVYTVYMCMFVCIYVPDSKTLTVSTSQLLIMYFFPLTMINQLKYLPIHSGSLSTDLSYF